MNQLAPFTHDIVSQWTQTRAVWNEGQYGMVSAIAHMEAANAKKNSPKLSEKCTSPSLRFARSFNMM